MLQVLCLQSPRIPRPICPLLLSFSLFSILFKGDVDCFPQVLQCTRAGFVTSADSRARKSDVKNSCWLSAVSFLILPSAGTAWIVLRRER